MSALEFDNLTPEQVAAVWKWWDDNDPNQEHYDCVDNTRYAILGNKDQEHAYEEIRKNGCCGSCDVELPLKDGSILLFGFNYGH
jgi:hypothetical protein